MNTSGLANAFKARQETWWVNRAACIDVDPTRFDVTPALTRLMNQDPEQWIAATREKAPVCLDCPVARYCARDALRVKDREIIRGGVAIPVRHGNMSTRHYHAADALLHDVANGIPLALVYELAPSFLERRFRDG